MPELSDDTIPASAIVVVAGDVLSSELGSEHVLLSLRDGTYYSLEEVGGEIWKLLQTPTSVAEVCRAIVEMSRTSSPSAVARMS